MSDKQNFCAAKAALDRLVDREGLRRDFDATVALFYPGARDFERLARAAKATAQRVFRNAKASCRFCEAVDRLSPPKNERYDARKLVGRVIGDRKILRVVRGEGRHADTVVECTCLACGERQTLLYRTAVANPRHRCAYGRAAGTRGGAR